MFPCNVYAPTIFFWNYFHLQYVSPVHIVSIVSGLDCEMLLKMHIVFSYNYKKAPYITFIANNTY